MSSLTFPNIDPIIFSFGPFAVSFYSLSYVIGVILGLIYASYLCKKFSHVNISRKQWEDFSTYIIIGIILGGRLIYVAFYNPSRYFANPIEILKTYEGGMSFHGGVIGITIAAFLFARKNKIEFLVITDLISMVAPIGIFLGRIANFFNGELYGRVTNVWWAFKFPGSDMLARHPSQLYEAFLEGLCILIIMFCNRQKLIRRGYISGLFLVIYAIFRIFAECFREPDINIGFLVNQLTMGQLLSIPMLFLGIYIIRRA